jgi:signal transduction histidine kinase
MPTFVEQRPRWQVMVIGVVLLALIAYTDWVARPELSLGPFHLIPVAMVAWWAGRNSGLFMAALTCIVWSGAMLKGNPREHKAILLGWGAISRGTFCAFTAVILSSWHDAGRMLGEMVASRTAALEEEVRDRKLAQAALQVLAAELAAAEDAHRRQLAHDLHDSLGQNLSLLKLNLESLRRDAPSNGSADALLLRQRLEDEIGTVAGLIQQARTLIFDLYPAILDDLGLVPTLEWYGEEFHRRTGIEVSVSQQGTGRALPTAMAHYLFRAIKELLGNAGKHGAAKEIVITLHWREEDVRVVVDDDGRGFDAAGALAPGKRSGLGLAGIRERVTALGGSLQLESRPTEGARVILQVPLPTSAKPAENAIAATVA